MPTGGRGTPGKRGSTGKKGPAGRVRSGGEEGGQRGGRGPTGRKMTGGEEGDQPAAAAVAHRPPVPPRRLSRASFRSASARDFNEVLAAEEHFGANERESWRIAGFQEVVADCGFLDLGFTGMQYTWDNRQDGNNNVKVPFGQGAWRR